MALTVCAALVLMLTFVLGGYAATKSYQFTGTVKSVDATTLTVEKSAKETWTFETSKDTKGIPKVGDKVTVNYKMVATDIEAKPAATATKKK
jgi:ABC-type enterochelin transport system substrate-binding protein